MEMREERTVVKKADEEEEKAIMKIYICKC